MPIINPKPQIHVIPAGKLVSSHRDGTHRTTMPSMSAGFRPPCRNDRSIKASVTTEYTEYTEKNNLFSVPSVLSVSNLARIKAGEF